MTTRTKTTSLATALILLGACGDADLDPIDATDARLGADVTIIAAEVLAITTFLNRPDTGLTRLDEEIGLNVIAAEMIIDHRAGDDGIYPSADDDTFDDVEELDAVEHVGPIAIELIREYVRTLPQHTGESVEGIQFTAEQATAVVWGVNRATQTELMEQVGLDERAANSLVDGAPYDSIAALGEAYWVGPIGLGMLRDYATVWSAAMAIAGATTQAGTFEGVDFDEPTARTALTICNDATYEQLIADSGIAATAAARIVAGRPYASLDEVSLTFGIGATTLEALRAYAASSVWE